MREKIIGDGHIPENSRITLRWYFNSRGKPCLGLYITEGKKFICQMELDETEILDAMEFFVRLTPPGVDDEDGTRGT